MKSEGLASKFKGVVDEVVSKYANIYNLRFHNTPPEELAEVFNKAGYRPTLDPASSFIMSNWDEISELHEFTTCCEFALDNYDLIAKYHPVGEIEYGIDEILKRFIRDVLIFKPGGLNYTQEDFNRVYSRYEGDILSETLTDRSFGGLQGLTVSGEYEEIEIGENSRIKRIDEWDKKTIRRVNGPETLLVQPDSPVIRIGPKLEYVFEISEDIPKSEFLGTPRVSKSPRNVDIRNFVIALQLVNENQTVNYASTISPGMGVWSMSGGGSYGTNPLVWRASYEIEEDDIDEIREIYSLIQSKDRDKMHTNLRMAINQYHSGIIRSDSRVTLSDMMIVLEGLLKRKDEEFLGKRKLAQRTAILLGDSQEEREKIYDEITELYDKRSTTWGVAHGGGSEGFEDEESVLDPARGYASECLVTVLKIEGDYGGLGGVLKSMTEKIDSGMLDIEFPSNRI